MNSYEVQNLLKDKVDRHEIHQLKSDLDSSERKIRALEQDISRAKNDTQNLKELTRQLIDMLLESEPDADQEDRLRNIRNQL